MQLPLRKVCAKAVALWSSHGGNVSLLFGLSLVPFVGAIGVAVDYTQASSVRTEMQSALDAAALSVIKTADGSSAAQVQNEALGFFQGSFNRKEAMNVQVAPQYDAGSSTLTIAGSATVPTPFMKILGFSSVTVGASSKAMLKAKQWPVCVLVTDPTAKHTFMATNGSKVDFENCMVQVNTQNWDAVEARDTSYIHSVNGENCFVGDIHYGNITPAKSPTCSLFADPFAAFKIPLPATCTKANTGVVVSKPATLTPGTFCGGLTISASSTLNPGLYVIKDGDLNISGSATNVTADGVTFILTGKGAGVTISTAGTVTITPASVANAGQFAGFSFFLDQNTAGYLSASTVSAAKMKATGVMYLNGQQLVVNKNANLTVTPGSIIASYILPDSATITLNGLSSPPSNAEVAMQKQSSQAGTPTLVQ